MSKFELVVMMRLVERSVCLYLRTDSGGETGLGDRVGILGGEPFDRTPFPECRGKLNDHLNVTMSAQTTVEPSWTMSILSSLLDALYIFCNGPFRL